MLKWIIRILLLVTAITLLNTLETNIHAVIGNYELYTTLPKLAILLVIVFVPFILVIKLIKLVFEKIRKKYYNVALVKIINAFNVEDEKEFLVDILKNNASLRFLRHLARIKNLINSEKYDKALYYCNTLKVRNSFRFIVLYYIAVINKANKNHSDYLSTCKQGTELYSNNSWFFEKLLEEALLTKNKNDLKYLNNSLGRIQFPTKTKYEKCFCLLQYTLAELHVKDDALDQAYKIAYTILKKFPAFTPAYKTLITISERKGDSKKIKEYLQSAWIENPNYDTIELWMEHYKEKDPQMVLQDLQKPFNHNKNKDMNMLLLAAVNINLNKLLNAYEALQKVGNDTPAKQAIELMIFEKEKNYNKIVHIMYAIIAETKSTWWSKFIK